MQDRTRSHLQHPEPSQHKDLPTWMLILLSAVERAGGAHTSDITEAQLQKFLSYGALGDHREMAKAILTWRNEYRGRRAKWQQARGTEQARQNRIREALAKLTPEDKAVLGLE